MGRRQKGTGTIRKRADGRYEGRVIIGYDDEGNQKVKTVTAKLRKDVVAKMESVRKENIIPLKGLKKDMPFGQWMDFWYQYYTKNTVRETTQATYEGEIYKHIIPEVGKIPLNKLTQADLQKFYADQLKSGRRIRQEIHGEGLSNAMVRHIHMLCKSALDIAVQEGFIRDNPAVGCKLPPKTKGEMKVLTTEQSQRLLIQAKQDGYYELFLLEFATGLRIGELIALQWDDLNPKTGVLSIDKQVALANNKMIMSKPKTKQSIRKIVLPRPVVDVLLEYKNRVDSVWMFPSPLSNERPWNASGLRGRLNLELERAQCPKVRFHDLRHPYVKHTTKIFSLRLKFFQAQPVPDALRKTRGAFLHLREGGNHNPFLRSCNKKLSSWSLPQSKMSLILYAISMRLSGYTSTLSMRRSVSSAVRPSELKTALAASCRLSCRACSSCFCFACANTTA